jgi:branched-subunit amino acid aminotransferase/4-amino-4-deoxychorismate lyase
MKDYCYLNGQIVPFGVARIQLNDLGALRGLGVFDYLRTYQGIPFRLDLYLNRLVASARAVGLHIPSSAEEITEIVEELLFLRADKSQEVGIRFVLTGGHSTDGVTLQNPTFYILIEPLAPVSPHLYEEGIKVLTYDYQRFLPEIKTTNYLPIYLQAEAMRQAAAQDLLYHQQGKITECTRNNFFMLKGRRLITAKDGILLGITRQTILEIAQEGFEIEIRDVQVEELAEATACFKSGSNQQIIPITQVDEHIIGAGKVTEEIRDLQRLFGDFTREIC